MNMYENSDPCEVVAKDLRDMGYLFAWQKLDAQSYLLRQRRTRIWGVADLMSDLKQDEFQSRMKKTLDSMAGTALFNYNEVFDVTKPKQRLKNELQRKKLKEAVDKARLKNGDTTEVPDVFIDTATGEKRAAESAEHVAPCIRTSHHIYSNYLGRCLSIDELWRCQGLFESAFVNTAAYHEVMKNTVQARDLAGQGVGQWFTVFKHTTHNLHYITFFKYVYINIHVYLQ